MGAPAADGVLDALDALASAWARAARPIVFRVASPAQLTDVFRLRYRAVVEEGWAAPGDVPDGLERTPDDDRAVHVVGVDAGQLVATSRLVLPVAGRRLPVEELFEISLDPRARLVELDRIVVSSAYRERGRGILAGLLGQSWHEARTRGFRGIVGIVSAAMIERYARLGIEFETLGGAREYWNEQRFPVRLDLRATAAGAPLRARSRPD